MLESQFFRDFVSLIDGVLLHPLPYRDPAHLAVIWSDFSPTGRQQPGFDRASFVLRLA